MARPPPTKSSRFSELIVEDSILVDKNITKPTKQVVMKGVITDKKLIKKWSLKKI